MSYRRSGCDFGSATTKVFLPDETWTVKKRDYVEDEMLIKGNVKNTKNDQDKVVKNLFTKKLPKISNLNIKKEDFPELKIKISKKLNNILN